MEAGSSHTTTSTCWAAWQNRATFSAIPAAVSTTRTSGWLCSCEKAEIIAACEACGRSAIVRSPDEAGTMRTPDGPVMMACSSCASPRIKCARLQAGCKPSRTSTLARLRSASMSMTLRPRCASATDRLTETLVLPTPPLPLVTAMTLVGLAATASRSSVACTELSMACLRAAEAFGQVQFFRQELIFGCVLKRLVHEPELAAHGARKIVRDPLPVAEIGQR